MSSAATSALRDFQRREGHVRLPVQHREAGRLLASWVRRQREFYQQRRLPKDRARALEAIPGWIWRPVEVRWQRALSVLKRDVQREGHALVRTFIAKARSDWVLAMRQRYRERLSRERVRILKGIRGWSWNAVRDRFPAHLALVKHFARRHGHALIPAKHVEREVLLGQWVANQRAAHRRKELSRDRVRALEAIPGWSWDPIEDNFQRVFALLKRFARREGHARPRGGQIQGGADLGTWVQARRAERRRGRLSPRRRSAARVTAGLVLGSARPRWSGSSAAWHCCADLRAAKVTRGCRQTLGKTASRWACGSRSDARSIAMVASRRSAGGSSRPCLDGAGGSEAEAIRRSLDQERRPGGSGPGTFHGHVWTAAISFRVH